jgi:hypothetical protein
MICLTLFLFSTNILHTQLAYNLNTQDLLLRSAASGLSLDLLTATYTSTPIIYEISGANNFLDGDLV